MQDIATVSEGAATFHRHVASHLLHPLLGRVSGDPSDFHPTTRQMDEKKDIVSYQSVQREDLHREKIGSRQHHEMSLNEGRPGGGVLTLRRRRYAVTTQNI